jgi:hypothetical protein
VAREVQRLRLGLQASAAEALTLWLQLLLCSSAHQTSWIYLLHMEKDYGIMGYQRDLIEVAA